MRIDLLESDRTIAQSLTHRGGVGNVPRFAPAAVEPPGQSAMLQGALPWPWNRRLQACEETHACPEEKNRPPAAT